MALDQLRISKDDHAAGKFDGRKGEKVVGARKKFEDKYTDEEGNVLTYGAGLY